MNRASSLAKLARALRLFAEAEAELRAAEEERPSPTKPVVTELDMARARAALERRGFRR